MPCTPRPRRRLAASVGALAAGALLVALPVCGAGPASGETQAPATANANATAEAGGSPPADALSVLLRTAIVTPDIDASRRFYVEGLGLKVRFDGDVSRPVVLTQLGLAPGQRVRFVVLEGATALAGRPVRGAMVGLLQVDQPALPPMQRPPGASLAAGEAMLAIETAYFADVAQRLRRLGAPVLVAPMRSPDGREIEMVVRDPAGIRVHVVGRP